MTFSPTDHLGLVTRRMSTATHDGDELLLLTVTKTFAATPAEVWDALVTAERIERWLAPVSGDLRVGGRFQVEGNAAGTVLACEEPERVSVTWEYAGDTSWVDASLRPVADGTLLQLDHRFAANEHYRTFGPGATGIGWESMLMGLTLHLADPSAPRPEGAALPDLADFFRGSGEQWRRAAVAGGDDPDQAAAASARCVAAYLGEG